MITLFMGHLCCRAEISSSAYRLSSFCLSSGVVHDSVPFLLPLALPQRLHEPVQRQRPAHAALGARVQVSLSSSATILPAIVTLELLSSPLRSKFDLYTKSTELPDVEKLKPYYQSLIDKYCPGVLKW